MAERIMITPQELNDAADHLISGLNNIESEIESINNKIDDVCSRWEGAAQQSFIAQYNDQLKPILTKSMPEVINGVAAELDTAADALRETDENLAAAFKG